MVRPAQNLRDDRAFPPTRRVAFGGFVILVPAVIVLWTAERHPRPLGWTIEPDLTPICLGSGYE